MEKVKVWVVVGKFDYEGDWLEDSGKVFFKKEDAVKYGEWLVNRDSKEYCVDYDEYSIKECEVE